jgi:hypothetical protein
VPLSRKSMKKLASLTALGAGAVALTPDNAEASVIYSGPMDAKVGIATGYGPTYVSPLLPGGAQFEFNLVSYAYTTATHHIVYHVISLYAKGLGGAAGPFFEKTQTNPPLPGSAMKVVNSGALWSTLGPPLENPLVAYRFWVGPIGYVYGLKSFTNKYAMFKFNGCAVSTCYGWIDLSLSVANKPPFRNTSNGPNLDVLGFAYDDSGTLIPAGYKGPNSIPEPSTFELAGLAALALGAEGLRRWRTARKA